MSWYDVYDRGLANHPPPTGCIYVVTGTQRFITSVMSSIPTADRGRSIVTVESPFRSTSGNLKRLLVSDTQYLKGLGLFTIATPNADFGGCTSAVHMWGFGTGICSFDALPKVLPNVQRNLSHCLNVALEGRFPSRPPPPPLVGGSLAVHYAVKQKGSYIIRHEGLLPCHAPATNILCPSVFTKAPNTYVVRQLTPKEALRVYSLPIGYDKTLLKSVVSIEEVLPFESAVSPDIVSSFAQQLWGLPSGGGLDGSVARELVSTGDTPQVAEGLKAEASEPVQVDSPTIVVPGSHQESSVNAVTNELTAKSASEIESVQDTDLASDSSMLASSPGSANFDNVEEMGVVGDTPIPVSSDTVGDEVTAEMVDNVQEECQARLVEAKGEQKAAKADDAEVPVHLWNDVIKEGTTPRKDRCDGCMDYAVSVLREWGLKRFWKRLYNDCIQRLRENYGREWFNLPRMKGGNQTSVGIEVQALSNIMWHSTECNWFEYKSGSAIHYFHFPIFYQGIAKDGVPVFFEKDGPRSMRGQPPVNDDQARKVLRSKVGKVIRRGYLFASGIRLRSLIKCFPVPKTEKDFRIVYDATANKLNDAVWAPSFWLPTVDTLVRYVDESTWMMDRDIGDMFLNFPLDRRVWPYTGLNLESLFDGTDEEDAEIIKMAGSIWVHWNRCLMGFKPSPYNSIKTALVVEEVAKGDRRSESNPFQWDHVRLNLPGNADYDPSISWISKIREDGLIACEIFTFVDDERLSGASRKLVWEAGHRLAYIQAYLGIQDAARKLRLMSQKAGTWAGAVVHAIPDVGVCVLTSEEKWKRFKDILFKWLERLERGDKDLDHKELMSDRGFCVHLCNSYPAMTPYLKGFHLTIEMWRGNRDAEGWKLNVHQVDEYDDLIADENYDVGMEEEFCDVDDTLLRFKLDANLPDDATTTTVSESTVSEETDQADPVMDEIPRAPASGFTTPALRFIDDLRALLRLSESDSPPIRVARSKTVVTAVYGFGDASGKGFCGTLGYHDQVNYRIGVWGRDEESESSNYKELCNLVETCEEEAAAGRLYNAEFYLFTDNSTSESCFYRGSSKSKLLHELIVRLRKLEMDYNLTIHLIHVAGTRMIAQGTDGGSRGSLLEGVLAGKPMLDFVDLGKTAVERHQPLLEWIRDWTNDPTLCPLTPEEWFVEGHGICGGQEDDAGVWIPTHEKPNQMHLWCPPPAVADAALEELLKARHKRTDTYHIIAIPRLMAPRWRRLYRKACDFSCEIPAGSAQWPSNMFEPLWLGVVLPFTHHRPWQLKRAPLLLEMEREMRQVLRDGQADGGRILCKLLQLNPRLCKLPESVARAVLRMPRDELRPELPNQRNEG